MASGYASLHKKTSEADALSSASVAGHSECVIAATPSSLHIVSTDRRASDSLGVSPYLISKTCLNSPYYFCKRSLDIIGAIAGLVLLSPLSLLVIVWTLLMGSSPIFRHRRVGQFGEFFDCLKFRTMVENADSVLHELLDSDRLAKEEWLRTHKLKNDPRITRIGKFLRKTSLDELPQLWNVLRGEMSLVGPRPVVPDELKRYGTRIQTYLSTRPGLTGLWQVSGRNELTYRRRVALDVCYVRAQDIRLDLYILVKTIPAVFAKNGAY